MQQWRSNWEAREGEAISGEVSLLPEKANANTNTNCNLKKDSNTNEGKFLYCNTTISLSDRWNEAFKQEEEEYFNG